jgi:hypothetical protein
MPQRVSPLQDSHGCERSRRPPHDSEDDGAEGRHREQDGSLALQYRVDKLVALACAQLDMLSARASQCT